MFGREKISGYNILQIGQKNFMLGFLIKIIILVECDATLSLKITPQCVGIIHHLNIVRLLIRPPGDPGLSV